MLQSFICRAVSLQQLDAADERHRCVYVAHGGDVVRFACAAEPQPQLAANGCFCPKPRQKPQALAVALAAHTDLASQLWLFMWAPVNGEGINVAMGYFLFPLMMVLLGSVWFKEQLAPLQWLAVALACAGVAHELWRNGTFSWVTVWVFGSYPLYYLMRRAQGVPALTGLFFDLLLIAPLALLYLLWQADSLALIAGQPWLIGFIVLLGLNSALAMQLNLQASQMLPFSLFGMLSYLEPILLFALSLILLNEQTPQGAFISYGLIWLGLALMVWHGMRRGGKRLFNFKQNSLNNQ